MQKITPFLWFNHQAEEAAKFYTSIFKKSKILKIVRYNENGAKASGKPKGSVMTVRFRLEGQDFVALNGGPQFKFNEAVSFVVNCRTQAEVDYFWKKLSAGGKAIQCGWLKDRYGVAWQIVPEILGKLLSRADAAASQHVMQALLKMVKLDIRRLKQAYEQASTGTDRRKKYENCHHWSRTRRGHFGPGVVQARTPNRLRGQGPEQRKSS